MRRACQRLQTNGRATTAQGKNSTLSIPVQHDRQRLRNPLLGPVVAALSPLGTSSDSAAAAGVLLDRTAPRTARVLQRAQADSIVCCVLRSTWAKPAMQGHANIPSATFLHAQLIAVARSFLPGSNLGARCPGPELRPPQPARTSFLLLFFAPSLSLWCFCTVGQVWMMTGGWLARRALHPCCSSMPSNLLPTDGLHRKRCSDDCSSTQQQQTSTSANNDEQTRLSCARPNITTQPHTVPWVPPSVLLTLPSHPLLSNEGHPPPRRSYRPPPRALLARFRPP